MDNKKIRAMIAVLILSLTLLAAGCAGQASTPQSSTSSPKPSSSTPTGTTSPSANLKSWTTPPPMSIDTNKQYTATIKTNFGDITVQLYPQDAPLTVNNFIFLSRQGFYDGVKFHRIAKGFVIQTGDPTGTGGGGPGYKFADEKVTRDYVKGTLAMANSGPNTNGSQFFITLADLSGRLPKNYTIFGLVTAGSDVVDKIANVPVEYSPGLGETSLPKVDVHINTVTIEEK